MLILAAQLAAFVLVDIQALRKYHSVYLYVYHYRLSEIQPSAIN